VARVLALADREAVRAADGTWAVRKAPERVPVTRRPLAPRPVSRPAAVLPDLDEPLPRAVNS
jgi:hypothetical protein